MHPNKKQGAKAAARTDILITLFVVITAVISLLLIFWPSLYHTFHSYDIQLLRNINANRPSGLDSFFIFITNTSSWICLGITAITLLIAQINRSKILTLKGLQLLVTFLTSFVLIKSLKFIIARERPFSTYNFLEKLAHTESLSFPSGHTFEAFAFATAISLLYKNKWVSYIIFLWALLVGMSRIILGVHYFSDVAAGLILGVLTGYAVHVLFTKNIA